MAPRRKQTTSLGARPSEQMPLDRGPSQPVDSRPLIAHFVLPHALHRKSKRAFSPARFAWPRREAFGASSIGVSARPWRGRTRAPTSARIPMLARKERATTEEKTRRAFFFPWKSRQIIVVVLLSSLVSSPHATTTLLRAGPRGRPDGIERQGRRRARGAAQAWAATTRRRTRMGTTRSH